MCADVDTLSPGIRVPPRSSLAGAPAAPPSLLARGPPVSLRGGGASCPRPAPCGGQCLAATRAGCPRWARTGQLGSEGGPQGRAAGGPGTALPTAVQRSARRPHRGSRVVGLRCHCSSPRRRTSPVSICHLGKGSSSKVPSACSPAASRAVAAGSGHSGTNERMREWEPGEFTLQSDLESKTVSTRKSS